MAVELDGNVRMRGDTGPGVGVKILAEEGRLRLVSGNELVGDWRVGDIGINALQDGFNVKVAGEEFILRTRDDAAFAEELGVTAVSPRLGRLLAARHKPEDRDIAGERPQISSNLAAIGFAVAGALILMGGTLLNISGSGAVATTSGDAGFQFWIAFIGGGILMIAAAYLMSTGMRTARLIATAILVALVAFFGFAVSESASGTGQLTAYGFISGGLVVGVAVLVSGSLRQPN